MIVTFPPFLTNKNIKSSLRQAFPWCSGYHIRLTRGRSPVRSRAETFLHLPLDLYQFKPHNIFRKVFFFTTESIYRQLPNALRRKFCQFRHLLGRQHQLWPTRRNSVRQHVPSDAGACFSLSPDGHTRNDKLWASEPHRQAVPNAEFLL
jgi:hypothetical protein